MEAPVEKKSSNAASSAKVATAAAPGKDVPGYQSGEGPKDAKANLKGIKVPKGYQLKLAPPKELSPEEQGYWSEFFTRKRGENCSGRKVLRYELQKIGIGEDGKKVEAGVRALIGTGPFGWIKQWGFGRTAYFFDFLDPSLRPLILEEFSKIWEKFSKYPKEDNEQYKDPFNLKQNLPDNLDSVSRERIQKVISKYNKNLQKGIYGNSLNAVQINSGLRENRWYMDRSVSDNAKGFIRKYDMNQDGRLSPREFILGSIYHNKGILGADECQLCYEDLTDKIDGIFAYIDCDNDGLLSSEDLYTNLPNLRRDTNKWNFFSLANKAPIRTAVTNDFILKNNFTVLGKLNKNEFRLGILLGFWDRQTDDYGIIKDDKKNMKNLRWMDDDVVDIGAMNYIKNKAEAEAETEKRKEAALAEKKSNENPAVQVDLSLPGSQNQ